MSTEPGGDACWRPPEDRAAEGRPAGGKVKAADERLRSPAEGPPEAVEAAEEKELIFEVQVVRCSFQRCSQRGSNCCIWVVIDDSTA